MTRKRTEGNKITELVHDETRPIYREKIAYSGTFHNFASRAWHQLGENSDHYMEYLMRDKQYRATVYSSCPVVFKRAQGNLTAAADSNFDSLR